MIALNVTVALLNLHWHANYNEHYAHTTVSPLDDRLVFHHGVALDRLIAKLGDCFQVRMVQMCQDIAEGMAFVAEQGMPDGVLRFSLVPRGRFNHWLAPA